MYATTRGFNYLFIPIHLNELQEVRMFAKLSIQIQIDEIAYTKIQSLLQREKPTPNEKKVLVDNLIKDNIKRVNNIRR